MPGKSVSANRIRYLTRGIILPTLLSRAKSPMLSVAVTKVMQSFWNSVPFWIAGVFYAPDTTELACLTHTNLLNTADMLGVQW